MLDDRDHRPDATNASLAAALRQARDDDRNIGCAFWAAVMAGGLIALLAGYGLAALVDGATDALLAVLR